MRKKILIILICIAIPVYIWDALLMFNGVSGAQSKTKIISALDVTPKPGEFAFASLRIVHFIETGKSPFLAQKEKPKPVETEKTSEKSKTEKTPPADAKPPRITITGIMWNPSNPVAMVTLPDGSSTVAKAGQALMGAIEVKKIEKNRVQVVYQGNVFWIEK
jgi:hypothetical protein